MTKQELKAKIDKLENGIKSKATPSNLIAPLKAQKAKLEKELQDMEASEKKAVKTKKVSKVAEKIKAAKKSVAKKTPAKAPAKEERKKDNIVRDGDRKSLPAGKRISKTGKVYYETRANRTDKQTSVKPYLAKGGMVKYFDNKEEWRLSRPSGSIEKEVLEKVKYYSSSDKDFVGNFGWRTASGKLAEGYLYRLDESDKDLVKDVKLKDGEKIYRYFTRTTAVGGITPLIKVNLDKGLLYFSDTDDADKVTFETKGTSSEWVSLIKDKMEIGGFLLGAAVGSVATSLLSKKSSKTDKDKVEDTKELTWKEKFRESVNEEGFDSAVTEYSEDVKDKRFNDLKTDYLVKSKALKKYIGSKDIIDSEYDISVQDAIDSEGFDYALIGYNDWKGVEDNKFQTLYDDYKKSQKSLDKYVGTSKSYSDGGELTEKKLIVLKADDEKGGNVFVSEEVVKVKDLDDAKSKVKEFVSKYNLDDKTFTGGRYFKLVKTSKKTGNVTSSDVKSEELGTIDYKGNFKSSGSKMDDGGEISKNVSKLLNDLNIAYKKNNEDQFQKISNQIHEVSDNEGLSEKEYQEWDNLREQDNQRRMDKFLNKMADGGEINWGADLGGGFSIGNDVYITDSKSLFEGNTGFVSGSVGRDLLVTILDNGNERSVVVSKKGVQKLDAPEYAKGGSLNNPKFFDYYQTLERWAHYRLTIEKGKDYYLPTDSTIEKILANDIMYNDGKVDKSTHDKMNTFLVQQLRDLKMNAYPEYSHGGMVEIGSEGMYRGGAAKVLKYDDKTKMYTIKYLNEDGEPEGNFVFARKDEFEYGFSNFNPKMADGGYVIFEGRDNYNDKPLYKVISKDEDNDYDGEFHDNREDAEKELNELKNKDMNYGYGGKTKSRKSTKDLTIEQISSMTGVGKAGVERFSDENNLSEDDLSNIMQGLGRRMISASDFATAVSGNKDNQYTKEIVDFAKSGKGYKMADGGMIYKMADNMTDAEYENKLSSLSEKQKKTYESLVRLGDSPKLALATTLLSNEAKWSDDTTRAYTMAKGGKVPAHFGSGRNIDVFGYQTQHFDICGAAVKEFEAAVEIMQNAKESEKESLARCAKYVDGLFGIEKLVVENSSADDANFYEAVSDIMSASIYNYRAEMSINLFSFVPQHLKEIAVRMAKAEKGGLYALGGMTAGRWYRDKSGEEFKFIGKIDSGENKGKFLFTDGQKSVYKDLEDFEGGRPKETKLFGFFEDGGSVAEGNYEMLMSNIKAIKHHAEELEGAVNPNTEIEAWVLSKSERAETDLSDITHYLDGLKMEKGGYMAKGGDLSSIKKKYEENEDENAHSENVVLLAKHFGTKEDLAKAKEILALHEKEGSLSSENGKKRQELHLKLIDKARAEMGKQGIEFEKGGYMASGGEVRYKLAGTNFGQQIENGKKFAELIKKAHENQTSEHKYPENFIKEIAYTGKIVKNDGTYFLKDYSYKGVLDRFEFLGDKYFLESLKYLNRPTIKNFKFEDGGMMAKGGEIAFDNSNLYLNGFGMDSNGNSVVKVSFPNQRAFSIQTNGVLKETNSLYTKNIKELTEAQIKTIEKEVVDYVKQFGSKEQKQRLKTYSGYMAKGGEFKPYGKTKGKYKIEYTEDGEKQSEVWESKEMVEDRGKRLLKLGHTNIKITELKQMAKGGIYSSDSLYILKVSKDGKEVGEERFRAKNIREAKEMGEDYEEKYKTKFGGDLSFSVKEAMASGGMTRKGGQPFEVEGRKFFYHKDDGNVYDSNHRLYAGSYSSLELAKKSLEKNFENIKTGNFYKDGGKVKFADKVKSVQESLLKRKKVAPQVQKDYGKTYSKAEAKESAQRIVGSRMAQLKEKMAKKKK